MTCSRWVEFFEGDNGRLSMTRLLCFLAFGPSTYVVIKTLNPEALGWYLSAFVLGYVGGKLGDAISAVKTKEKDDVPAVGSA